MTAPKLGNGTCQCTACDDLFNSTTAFDGHRVGAFETLTSGSQRRCLTPAEMEDKGWLRNSRGFWITGSREASTSTLEQPSDSPIATPVAGGVQ